MQMPQIKILLILFFVGVVFALPFVSYAAQCVPEPGVECIEPPIKAKTIPDLICMATKFLSSVLMPPILVLMVLWASFLYLTSAGQPGKIRQGNEVLIWAIVGAGVLLLATALITLVLDTLQASQQAKNIITTPGLCSWDSTKITVIDAILRVVNLFSWFIGVAAVAMGLYSGYLFITSRGNPQNAVKAGKTLFYAIVGVAAAIIAYSIIGILEAFLQ